MEDQPLSNNGTQKVNIKLTISMFWWHGKRRRDCSFTRNITKRSEFFNLYLSLHYAVCIVRLPGAY